MTLGDVLDVVRPGNGEQALAGQQRQSPGVVDCRTTRGASTRGAVFVALQRPAGRRRRVRRRRRSRAAPPPSSPNRRRPDGIAVPWMPSADARLALALLADRVLRPSEPPHAGRRHHRHQRQDHDGVPARRRSSRRPGCRCGRARHGRATASAREEREAARTTPEAPDVQQLLREMVERGCRACVMEVSSHALALQRVDGMHFAAARVHEPDARPPRLPRDMEDLLRGEAPPVRDAAAPTRPAIINLDDPRGAVAAGRVPAAPVTYAHRRARPTSRRARSRCRCDGLTLDVRTPRGTVAIRSPLVGRPNVYNILAAAADGRWRSTSRSRPSSAASRPWPACPAASRSCPAAGDDVTVVVDYAHTDDALRNLLETARPLARRAA